jgi:hypothetical protein
MLIGGALDGGKNPEHLAIIDRNQVLRAASDERSWRGFSGVSRPALLAKMSTEYHF